MVIFRRYPPAEGVLVEVVPFLQHPLLGPFAGPPVGSRRDVLVRTGPYSAMACLEPRSWPGGDLGPMPPRITTLTLSSFSTSKKASLRSTSDPRFWALRVLRPIEEDPDDLPPVELFVRHEFVRPALRCSSFTSSRRRYQRPVSMPQRSTASTRCQSPPGRTCMSPSALSRPAASPLMASFVTPLLCRY